LAVSLPSDIVLDVARAVEPDAFEAARAKLASLAGRALGAEAPAARFSIADLRDSAMAKGATTEETPEAYRKFEAVVLSTFVQSMMPSKAGAVYGEGLSGDMWKQLLAQQLGTVMSDRGGIGIADSLIKDHYMDGDVKVALSGVSDGPGKAQHDQERDLSAALVQELQRRLTADIAGDVGAADKE
jgi:peptidoglycan hydrolase FlgJ